MENMSKKVYLILGASSDLGLSLIRRLLSDGQAAQLIVYAHFHRDNPALNELAMLNPAVHTIQADLSDLEDVTSMIRFIQESEDIPTHIISFAAADYHYNRLPEWDSNRVEQDMTIQVYAVAEILKVFLTYMVKRSYGKIVLMLSSCTIGIPPKNLSAYTTVKYAVLGLIKSIAADYGDQGININGISPAMIETKFVKGIGRKMREVNAECNPKHRNLQAEDVIPAIEYLLSDKAEFVNGTNLNLSGQGD